MMLRLLGWSGLVAFLLCCLVPVIAGDPAISREERIIRDALEGAPVIGSTGDGMLDDVLSVMRSRGSILDGSVLDPSAEDQTGLSIGLSRGSAVARTARAAEQLLKAARLLEAEPDSNRSRQDLVGRMRAEAAALISASTLSE